MRRRVDLQSRIERAKVATKASESVKFDLWLKLALLVAIALVLLASKIAGAAPVDFTSNSALTTKGVQTREVSVGDLVADAIRAAAGVQIAFVPASELREIQSEISAGKVNSQRITELLSYPEEPLVIVKLTGAEVRAALEKSISTYPGNNLGFLQVSGLRFTYNPAAKSGERVGDVTVGNQPLSPQGSYQVAMTKSLGGGAIGYWRIWKDNDIQSDLGVNYTQAVESFLSGKTVDYSTTNRISRK